MKFKSKLQIYYTMQLISRIEVNSMIMSKMLQTLEVFIIMDSIIWS